MLPKSSANFTLPSLYDDLELNCRCYFPKVRSVAQESRFSGVAVFAHPYAPLGGSYDDPVVHSVGSTLTQQGFVLFTFNFRGAEGSAGKTSWSGKGELGDYVSIYLLAIAFLNTHGINDHLVHADTGFHNVCPKLILGGYSYGSMITAHLPAIATIVNIWLHAKEGTSDFEICHRAEELAQAFLGYLENHQHRGRNSLQVSGALSPGGATFGGYESPKAAQKIRRESSRHSIDTERVRQSVDRVRRKIGSRHSSNQYREAVENDDSPTEITHVQPELMYLLVSPLLGPISNLATLFARLKFERRDRAATAAKDVPATEVGDVLTEHDSLVVFGSEDHFTSSYKVRSWCEGLKDRPKSRLSFQEVLHNGHFWHSAEAESQLKTAVNDWLRPVD